MNASNLLLGIGLGLISIQLSAQSIDSTHRFNEVEIIRKQAPRMLMATQNVELISSSDLKSDACCNLSESFMRNGAVDVQYSDGVSGAKEIRMLGLDGNYLQTMFENLPGIRGLQNNFGMEHLPATWISSIQINKGTGSVVNGYEAITGQINIELQKPQSADKFFFNAYVNQDARFELNAHIAHKIKDKHWYTMTSAHGAVNWLKLDFNHDGFMDNPLFNRFSLMHRWFHIKKDGGMFMVVARVNAEDRKAGQMDYNHRSKNDLQTAWGTQLKTLNGEVFGKTSFYLPADQNIGLQWKFTYNQLQGFVGLKPLSARQYTGYGNFIYQKDIGEKNTLKLGASLLVDNPTERFDTFELKRLEIVPGAFGEWTVNPFKKLNIVAGLRVDQHNLFGTFLSPRLHLKWDILHDLTLRASGGRGYRVPNQLNENYSLFFSNRKIELAELKPEIAWNFGVSVAKSFNLAFREGYIHFDYYRTQFEQQLVSDLETPQLLDIYVAKGGYSNSIQAEASYEVVKNVNLKLVYKWDNVMVNYKSGLKINPLRPQHKILLVADYTWRKPQLKFTTNLAWYSLARIPNTTDPLGGHVHVAPSKNMWIWNMQISKTIKERWEVYLGAENMLNHRQHNPIIDANQPTSSAFDATLIWGPIRGAMAYAGVRFHLE